MTITAQTPTVTYNGNSVTTSWAFTFEIPYQSDGVTPAVYVYLTLNAMITPLVLGTDYTITGVGAQGGGSITTMGVNSPVPTGTTITIRRNLFYDQSYAFPNQGFLASNIEAALDKLTMLVQDNLLVIPTQPPGGVLTFNTRSGAVVLIPADVTGVGGFLTSGGAITGPTSFSVPPTLPVYTVATLPAAGTAGRRAMVTDATAPTFLGTLTGGGSVRTPVFDNGSAWIAG